MNRSNILEDEYEQESEYEFQYCIFAIKCIILSYPILRKSKLTSRFIF